jgi:hypothetical protein
MDAVLSARPNTFGSSSLRVSRSSSRQAVIWCVAPLSTTDVGCTGSPASRIESWVNIAVSAQGFVSISPSSGHSMGTNSFPSSSISAHGCMGSLPTVRPTHDSCSSNRALEREMRPSSFESSFLACVFLPRWAPRCPRWWFLLT